MLISGTQIFFICVFQPLFTFFFCMHFFNLKGWMAHVERTQKYIVMFDFFKSNMNPKDNSPLVIPLKHKPIPFFVASSSGSKVEPNFDFNHNNPIV